MIFNSCEQDVYFQGCFFTGMTRFPGKMNNLTGTREYGTPGIENKFETPLSFSRTKFSFEIENRNFFSEENQKKRKGIFFEHVTFLVLNRRRRDNFFCET